MGWINSHPEELRNGAVMILSVMMLGTPLSPFAVGYLGGVGTSWIIQRWENGKIDPRQLQIDGLIGAGSEALFMLIGRVYRVVRSGKGVEFNTSGGRLSIPGQAPSSMAKFDTRLVGAAESKILQAGESGFYTRLKPGDAGYGILKSPARELQETRYPKIEVKPVTGGASSATEVPPVAVSRVDVPQVAPVEGSGASRGASQVPVKPVEAPQVGEVPPASGAGSGAAGMQAVKPGGVADDAVAARGSAGGVREPEVQLKPVEEPKVENLPPAKGAGAAEGPTVSMRDVQTRLDERLEGVRRKEWRGKDKKGRPRTDYYDFKEYREKAHDYIDAKTKYKADLKEYKELKHQANLEGKEFTLDPPEVPTPPQHALWKDADERFAPDLNTSMQLDEEGLKHHRVVRGEDYEGQIPQGVADYLEETVQKVVKDGAPPNRLGANEGRNFDNIPEEGEGIGNILPTADVKGGNITYTEMDFMPPRPKIDKDGKVILKADGEPEMTRGTERLVIGSNGSIYLTLDHYHTFILLID